LARHAQELREQRPVLGRREVMEEERRDREVEGAVPEGEAKRVGADRGKAVVVAEAAARGEVPPLQVEREEPGPGPVLRERAAEPLVDRPGSGADVEDARRPPERANARREVPDEGACRAPAAMDEVDVLERPAHLLARQRRVVEELAAR